MSNLIICEHQFLQCCNRVVIHQPDVSGLACAAQVGFCLVDGATLARLWRIEDCS